MLQVSEVNSPTTRSGFWRRVTRMLGFVLLLVAAAALVYEFKAAVDTGSYRLIPLGELWFKAHVGSLNLSQAVIQRYVHPTLWDPIIVSVLKWPLWSVAGAVGAFLVLLTSRGAKPEE